MPLTFIGKAATNAIQVNRYNSPSYVALYYNKNNTGWVEYNVKSNSDIIQFGEGETIAFSGNNNAWSSNGTNSNRFNMTGTIEASGNVQSLMNFNDNGPSGYFANLFLNF